MPSNEAVETKYPLRRTCKSFTSKQSQEYRKECVEQYQDCIAKSILNDWIENSPVARHVVGDCDAPDKADGIKLASG